MGGGGATAVAALQPPSRRLGAPPATASAFHPRLTLSCWVPRTPEGARELAFTAATSSLPTLHTRHGRGTPGLAAAALAFS